MSQNREMVFVVVPCFNEGAVVRKTVQELLAEGLRVVVVDDGSDRPVADTCGDLPIHLLRHGVNLGQGAALQTGVEFALWAGAQYVIHFDADGQHDAAAIDGILALLRSRSVDVVLGSRFLDPSLARDVPWAKRLVLRGAILVSWLFSGMLLTDTHNGLRGFTRAAAERVRLTEDGFGHATEILGEIRRAKLRYREIPVRVRYTEYSKAKGQRLSNSLNVLIDLVERKLTP